MPSWEHDLTGGGPLIECDLPLESNDAVVHDELVLRGWAASPKGISGIAVQIGERQWNAAYGLDTPAVADRLPAIDGAARAGYHLAIDTSGWEPGNRVVTVAAFDREGGRAAVEGTIEVLPFAAPSSGPAAPDGEVALALDSPAIEDGVATIAGPLTVSGWAHASGGLEAVLVTLDGSLQQEAPRPIARPDLLRRLGPDAAAEAGFALRLDPSECPPGTHRLVVSAIARDGRVAGIECDVECRPPASAETAALPTAIDPLTADAAPPGPRDTDALSDEAETWRSRALIAEADAALARAEARLARLGEERARGALRRARDR